MPTVTTLHEGRGGGVPRGDFAMFVSSQFTSRTGPWNVRRTMIPLVLTTSESILHFQEPL